jgi:predicted RNA-binding Zn-ribbon protein involved in translation (DUF1610 family)
MKGLAETPFGKIRKALAGAKKPEKEKLKEAPEEEGVPVSSGEYKEALKTGSLCPNCKYTQPEPLSSELKKRRTHYNCPNCGVHFWVDAESGKFGYETEENAEYFKAKAEAKIAKSKVKRFDAEYYAAQSAGFESRLKGLRGKIKIGFFEALIPLIIAVPLIIFLPTFLFLGIAIACLPIYFMFRRTMLRGGSKFIIIFFSWFQFALMTPQLFVALIILWAGYFSMPTKYDEDDATKQMEAWVRVILGLLLSFNLYAALGGRTILSILPTLPPSAEQLPILLMSVAFFFTLPAVKPKTGSVNIYLGVKGIPYTMAGRYTGAIVFYTFMIFALVTSLNVWSFSSSLGLSFIIFWFIGLFLGLAGGREGRPYTGVIVVLFAVFFFSAQFSGIVGTTIFGQWWPQIQTFGQNTLAPLGQVSTQLSSGVGDAWLLITNPAEYWRKQQVEQLTDQTTVKPSGTVQAIEITRLEFLSTTQLDLIDQPLLGTAELENQGEFSASNVNATVTAYWVNSQSGVRKKVGIIKTLICSVGAAPVTPSTGKCSWNGTTYPSEIKTISFTFQKDGWGSDLQAQDETKKYVHAGEMVSANLSLEFNYNVNASSPIEVIDQDLYQRLLQSREITPQQISSQYSGGPVKATIASQQKQPIVNQQEAIIIAVISNEGTGILSSIDGFQIFVPADLNPKNSFESSTFSYKGKQGCSDATLINDVDSPFNGYYKFQCHHDKAIMSGASNFVTLSFLIQPDNKNVDRKTYGIVGLATYKYSNSKETQIQIAPMPASEVV